jgi:hypothetical protein
MLLGFVVIYRIVGELIPAILICVVGYFGLGWIWSLLRRASKSRSWIDEGAASTDPAPPKHRRPTLIELLTFIALIAIVIGLLENFWWGRPLLLIPYLGFAWVIYLVRVLPQVTPNVPAILSGIVCLASLVVGLHYSLRWLSTRIRTARTELATPARDWPWRWTLAGVGAVVLMFVAGTAAVGVTQQTTWLVRSPEPLWVRGSFSPLWNRMVSSNNLKQVGLAAHDYHQAFKHLPPGGDFDGQGRGLHGWQTHLLPYVEQGNLFQRVDLKLPWHHPANQPALATKIDIYLHPGQELAGNKHGYALSHYAANVRVLGSHAPLRLEQITDGTGNTLLAGEAGDRFLPWGHPANWRDPAAGLNQSPTGFGSPVREAEVTFAFVDGSVRRLSGRISPDVLRALSTPNGGEAIPSLD